MRLWLRRCLAQIIVWWMEGYRNPQQGTPSLRGQRVFCKRPNPRLNSCFKCNGKQERATSITDLKRVIVQSINHYLKLE